jgi:sulfonate transport system permease protein
MIVRLERFAAIVRAAHAGPVPEGGASPAEALAARLSPFVLPVLLLAAWEAVARLDLLPAYLFPAPSSVLAELRTLAASGQLTFHLWRSFERVISGFLLGALTATLVGALTGYSAAWRRLLDPALQSLRSIPAIAWVPIFILWLGIAEPSKIALIALGVFFPVYLNLLAGIANVDRKLIEAARVYRLRGARLVRMVLLPASLPSYVTGLRTGFSLAWMFVVAAELMGASQGIGFLLLDGENNGQPALILASMLIFALAGKTTDTAIALIARRVLRWQDTLENGATR